MGRILLVEDNEMNRDMLCRRLERKGYEVITAENGAQALKLAEQERPDLILMDLSLPEIDGYEATRRLKQSATTGAIPIIILTAHALKSDRNKAFASGCDDFDIKPIDFPRLLEKIANLNGSGKAA